MDRLKAKRSEADRQQATYLHSNMDRLKADCLTAHRLPEAIYIPIWID